MYESLRDKRILLTGGASGIGLATAERLMREGARVGIIDINQTRIAQMVDRRQVTAGESADVADRGQVHRAMDRLVEQLGGLDVLIANAGISVRTPLLEISGEQWRKVLSTNLDGVFHCSQHAARLMRARGAEGVILMMSSTNGLRGHAFYADYNASKAGVLLLARSMAVELAPLIRVNAVCPGYVLTPMQEAEYTPEMLEAVNQKLPLGRHARPEEVAALFAFLASSEARYITGQGICIDGGETA